MADYEAIVIGSGAGGLSAALRMSQLGASVLVLEAMPAFGGYLNAFRHNGFRFDTGVHYLGKLARGGSFRLLLTLLKLDIDRYIFPDFELRMCKGRQRYKERLHQLFPNESKALNKYFSLLEAMVAAINNTQSPPKNIFDKFMYVVRNPVLVRYFRSTYQQMLDSITSNAHLQAALSAHCGNSGLPPKRASAFFSLMLLDHYLDGAFYPMGGSNALKNAFLGGLRDQHAAMKQNAPVTRIECQDGLFRVTTRSGEQFTARAVISNADPLITFRRLVDPAIMPRALKRKVKRLRPSTGALYAFVGTEMNPARAGLSDANLFYFQYTDLNRCFETLQARKNTDSFPYYFITSPTLKDPSGGHAPHGYHTLQIISGFGHNHPFVQWSGTTPSRQRGEAYDSLKRQIGMQLIRSAERHIPELSLHLNHVEFATPLTNAYWVNSYQGANFGLEQTPDQFGPRRFFDCTTGIDGLFVVGSGAIGGGVLSCVASGVWAANQAVGYLNFS